MRVSLIRFMVGSAGPAERRPTSYRDLARRRRVAPSTCLDRVDRLRRTSVGARLHRAARPAGPRPPPPGLLAVRTARTTARWSASSSAPPAHPHTRAVHLLTRPDDSSSTSPPVTWKTFSGSPSIPHRPSRGHVGPPTWSPSWQGGHSCHPPDATGPARVASGQVPAVVAAQAGSRSRPQSADRGRAQGRSARPGARCRARCARSRSPCAVGRRLASLQVQINCTLFHLRGVHPEHLRLEAGGCRPSRPLRSGAHC